MFALKSVILAYITILGSISLLNAAPITSAVEPTQTIRDGYTYTPGVGAHKVHTQWVTWNTARRNCESEGAYLAIINSVAEADAIVRLLSPSHLAKVFVGIHDLYHEEEFVTIHGESVGASGFNRWQNEEPNDGQNNQDCVVLNDDGKYDDLQCTDRRPYVCELRDVPLKVQTLSVDVDAPTETSNSEVVESSTTDSPSDDYHFNSSI